MRSVCNVSLEWIVRRAGVSTHPLNPWFSRLITTVPMLPLLRAQVAEQPVSWKFLQFSLRRRLPWFAPQAEANGREWARDLSAMTRETLLGGSISFTGTGQSDIEKPIKVHRLEHFHDQRLWMVVWSSAWAWSFQPLRPYGLLASDCFLNNQR